jgi:hypothetical protein
MAAARAAAAPARRRARPGVAHTPGRGRHCRRRRHAAAARGPRPPMARGRGASGPCAPVGAGVDRRIEALAPAPLCCQVAAQVAGLVALPDLLLLPAGAVRVDLHRAVACAGRRARARGACVCVCVCVCVAPAMRSRAAPGPALFEPNPPSHYPTTHPPPFYLPSLTLMPQSSVGVFTI